MKKQLFVYALVVAGAIATNSCKKCHDCHYDGPSGEVEIGELCGDDLESAEENGYKVGDSTYTVHCHAH